MSLVLHLDNELARDEFKIRGARRLRIEKVRVVVLEVRLWLDSGDL
jgi:hypothetical protein